MSTSGHTNSNDVAAASPSPAAVAPLQPFRAPRRRLPTVLTLHQLCRVPRLLVVRIAPALLCLCCASRRGVSPLDFSPVGRTSSRNASGHCISWHDYSLSGLHRLYCAYVVHPDATSRRSTSRRSVALALAVSRRDYSPSELHRLYCAYTVHPDAPSRRSTSHRSVALALAVRPVPVSRDATTHRPDCTGSTAPMPGIRTRRLDARLLINRSHWLSPCARSFCCAS
jgi:hypothetical protein